MRTMEKMVRHSRINDEVLGKVYHLFLYEISDFTDTDDGEVCYNHKFLVKSNELQIEEWYDTRDDAMVEYKSVLYWY